MKSIYNCFSGYLFFSLRIFLAFNLKAFVTTQTLDKLIAAAPNIGFSVIPNTGYHTPAARGGRRADILELPANGQKAKSEYSGDRSGTYHCNKAAFDDGQLPGGGKHLRQGYLHELPAEAEIGRAHV